MEAGIKPGRTGNSYNLMAKVSKEYLAGLIDGEGSISVFNYTDSNGVCVSVEMTNSDKRLVEIFLQYGGTISIRESGYDTERYGNKVIYRWVANSRRASRLLMDIKPFLIRLKEKAIIALRIIRKVQENKSRKPLSTKRIRELQKLKKLFYA